MLLLLLLLLLLLWLLLLLLFFAPAPAPPAHQEVCEGLHQTVAASVVSHLHLGQWDMSSVPVTTDQSQYASQTNSNQLELEPSCSLLHLHSLPVVYSRHPLLGVQGGEVLQGQLPQHSPYLGEVEGIQVYMAV